ncbi:LAGLIDADG family homing endonuclease [Virgibacillus ihumii]|uniref:LAGLIDADG family homing endonuclease n=1 Tax=Virgibacillus ihumii TaxID=2686091 RepID=UPI00157DF443|nr:LAGLIDADG family homing endonuclease [Virgibacillus ihumii]
MKDWEASYIAGIIDGEGSITLTKMHVREHRRPCISISSNDKELLLYIQNLAGGSIYNKKNYNPAKHQNSYTLYIKTKKEVFNILRVIQPFLRIEQKRKRAKWILDEYDLVTVRNGKYNEELLNQKITFENNFLIFR